MLSGMTEVSPAMAAYLEALQAQLAEAMAIAEEARRAGLDPTTRVEIPVANDLADRVEALLGITGVAARIRELETEMSREEAALRIGDDFVARRFGETTREEILDHAIRTAMALLTEGVVAAPTEGIGKVGLGRNDDGSEYLKVYYAGPIRSAGGTAQALSVLVGDYVRQALGINRYLPRPEEIERYVEEIRQYNSIMSLQYLPSETEIRMIVQNCPVCIDGEATEQQEVSGYRNLERVETNTVRGGMALVIAEGLALKAPKVQKNVRKMRMAGWDWLDILIGGAAKADDEEVGVKPKDKYLRDLIAGRPVFSHPMRKGRLPPPVRPGAEHRLRGGRPEPGDHAPARRVSRHRDADEGRAPGQGGRDRARGHDRGPDGRAPERGRAPNRRPGRGPAGRPGGRADPGRGRDSHLVRRVPREQPRPRPGRRTATSGGGSSTRPRRRRTRSRRSGTRSPAATSTRPSSPSSTTCRRPRSTRSPGSSRGAGGLRPAPSACRTSRNRSGGSRRRSCRTASGTARS